MKVSVPAAHLNHQMQLSSNSQSQMSRQCSELAMDLMRRRPRQKPWQLPLLPMSSKCTQAAGSATLFCGCASFFTSYSLPTQVLWQYLVFSLARDG